MDLKKIYLEVYGENASGRIFIDDMLTRDYLDGNMTEILAESATKNEIQFKVIKDNIPVAEWTGQDDFSITATNYF